MSAEERKPRFPVPPPGEDLLSETLAGDAEACRARSEAWAAAGVDHIVIQQMPPMDAMRFFGEKVVHHFA